MNGTRVRLAPAHQHERVLVVVLHHVAAVGLHRVGAGALVKHGGRRRGRTPRARGARRSRACRCSRVISRSERLATLSARERLSTATMSVSPRAFSAFTRFEPMNPAAPVTMSVIAHAPRGSRRARRDARRRCRACRRRCPPRGWRRASPSCRSAPQATISASTPITVSPAPLTSKTSRARVASWWLLRREERHAFLAARHDERLEVELEAQLLRAPREVGLVAPAADHLAQLAAVGREHRGAPRSASSRRPSDRRAPACRARAPSRSSSGRARGRPCRSRRARSRRPCPPGARSRPASPRAPRGSGGCSKSMRSSCWCWPITRSLTIVESSGSRCSDDCTPLGREQALQRLRRPRPGRPP